MNVNFKSLVLSYPAGYDRTKRQMAVEDMVKTCVAKEAKKSKKGSVVDLLTVKKDSDIFIRSKKDGTVELSVEKNSYDVPDLFENELTFEKPMQKSPEIKQQIDVNNLKKAQIKAKINDFIKTCRTYGMSSK